MDVLVKDDVFHFKKFDVHQDQCLMKVCTDGVLLGAWAGISGVQSVLDIGTGTGVIALMLAQRSEAIQNIVGVEVDGYSYRQAAENAKESQWPERLTMVHQSIQDYVDETVQTFDLIISNPPFFTGGTLSDSQSKNDVRHTVKLPHGDLLRSVNKLLNPGGHFSVILPVMEGYRFIELAEQYRLYLTRQTNVYSVTGKPTERLLLEFSPGKPKNVLKEDLTIHHPDHHAFSAEYIDLTKDFYLNF